MNAPFRTPAANHPEIPDGSTSLPWTAVVEPLMGLWEPVIGPSGLPLASTSPDLAKAFAKGHRGAITIDMGMSPARPTVEAIRQAANPPRAIPVSFDIEAMAPGDIGGTGIQMRSSFDAWRC